MVKGKRVGCKIILAVGGTPEKKKKKQLNNIKDLYM